MNIKRFLWLLSAYLILLLVPTSLLSQKAKSKTVVKAAIESGTVNLHHYFGDGILYRGIFRVQSRINFSRSHLLIKGRFSKEYFDIKESIKSFNQQGNLTYVKYFVNSFLQLNSSFNHHSSSISSFGIQDINEWQLAALYNKKISNLFSLTIRDTYFFRNFSINNTDYTKNRALLSLSYYMPKNIIFNTGLFWENLHLQNADTTNSKDLLGIQIDYQYSKLIIFNLIYNFAFSLDKDYSSHQVNFVAGKYLSKKWSLFISMLYTMIMDDKNYLELFNRAEVFNNINVKLGYDIFENTHIYLKGILEDHKLVNYREKVTSRQIVFGIQQKL